MRLGLLLVKVVANFCQARQTAAAFTTRAWQCQRRGYRIGREQALARRVDRWQSKLLATADQDQAERSDDHAERAGGSAEDRVGGLDCGSVHDDADARKCCAAVQLRAVRRFRVARQACNLPAGNLARVWRL